MTSNRNSIRSWLPISIFRSKSIWPLEVGSVKDFGQREPNAMPGRRRGGGTLEGSADRADGATGRGIVIVPRWWTGVLAWSIEQWQK